MKQEIEEWKQIEDSDYFISSFGNVKSTKNTKHRILKAGINSSGYKQVLLTINNKKKSYTVHQLVAIYFLKHIVNGYKRIINHKDNLEIITQRMNSNKQHIRNSSKYTGVYWSKEKQQ